MSFKQAPAIIGSLLFLLNPLGLAQPILKVSEPHQGRLKIQVVEDDGQPVHVGDFLGRRGVLELYTWVGGDSRPENARDLVISGRQIPDYDPAVQQLQLNLNWPDQVNGPFGRLQIELLLQPRKGESLSRTISADLKNLVPVEWGITPSAVNGLIAEIQTLQTADENLTTLTELFDNQKDASVCDHYLLLNNRLYPTRYDHCQLVANPVMGRETLDSYCTDLTDSIRDNLAEQSRQQCRLSAELEKRSWPESQFQIMTAIQQKRIEQSNVLPPVNLTRLQQSTGMMDNELSYDAMSELNRYAALINLRLTGSSRGLKYLSEQKAFRDLVISEMIRAVVLHHFRQRSQYADACTDYYGEESAIFCQRLVADLSVQMVEVYGFSDLLQFNQSLAIFQSEYIDWATQIMGVEQAKRSKEYITRWASEWVDSPDNAPLCARYQLYPL